MVLLTIPAMSQERKYKKAMKAVIEEMQKAEGPDEEMELVESFEAIAEKYPDQWIPSYHAARILITSSFAETDGEKSDAMLERAKGWTERAKNLLFGSQLTFERRVIDERSHRGVLSSREG